MTDAPDERRAQILKAVDGATVDALFRQKAATYRIFVRHGFSLREDRVTGISTFACGSGRPVPAAQRLAKPLEQTIRFMTPASPP